MTGIHINRPSSTRFIARVRDRGQRKWRVASRPLKSRDRAILAMARAFAKGRHSHGDVIMVADWYDPVPIASLRRA